MKDLTEQIYDELNAQVVRMLEHAQKQAERIAELERENSSLAYELNAALSGGTVSVPAAASAPVVEHKPNELRIWLSNLENEVMPLHSDAKKLFTRVRTYLQECGYFKAPQPAVDTDKVICANLGELLLTQAERKAADTDKLREAILAMRCTNPYAEDKCNLYKEGYAVARQEAADLVASTALQAPVREVPEGWQLVPIVPTDEMIEELRINIDFSYEEGLEISTGKYHPCALIKDASIGEAYSAMLAAAPLAESAVEVQKLRFDLANAVRAAEGFATEAAAWSQRAFKAEERNAALASPADALSAGGRVDAVADAARSVLREALDAAEVHPCDTNNDSARAKQLSSLMHNLYRAILQSQKGEQ